MVLNLNFLHLSKTALAIVKSHLRAIAGVVAFALLKAWEGGGMHLDLATAETAVAAALLPVLLRYLDSAETAFGRGSTPAAVPPADPVVAPDPAPAAEDPVAPAPPVDSVL